METTGAEPKPTGADSSPTMPEPPTIIPDQFAAGFGWVIKNNTVMFQQPNNVCALVYPTARSFNKSDITSLVYRITRIKEVPQTDTQLKNHNLQADHTVAGQYPLARGVSISHPSLAVQTPMANGCCLATERDLLGDDKNQAVTENNNVLSALPNSAESEKASFLNQQHLKKCRPLHLNDDIRKDEGERLDGQFKGVSDHAVTENNNMLSALQADVPNSTESERAYILNQQHLKKSRPLHLNGDMRKDEGKKLDRPFNGKLNHQAVTENNNVLSALQADEPTSAESEDVSLLNQQHLKKKPDPCLQCVTQMHHDPTLERHLTTQEKTSSQTLESTDAETNSGEENKTKGAKKQLNQDVRENRQHVKPVNSCFRCERCDFKARSARRLDAHLRRQHAEGSVRCTLCPFTALNQRGLNMHVRRTHSNKSQEDPDDLEREKNDDISEHLEKHGKTGLLQCPQCDYLTKWRKNMRQHVRDVHTTSHNLHKTSHNLGYKCPDCGQTFRTVSLLRLHVRRKHTGERPFQCPHCSYAALVSSHLERHILRHTGVRPFMCEDCGYMASTKDVLSNHRRTHSGEKPYRCEVCGYAARRRHHLQGHMAKHAPNKPDRKFKCEFCDYAAVRKFHLVRHMSRHYGEKPFKCYMCEYSTVDNSRLQAHIRAHTGEKPFRCELCEFATARKDHLKQHVIRCWRKQTNKQKTNKQTNKNKQDHLK